MSELTEADYYSIIGKQLHDAGPIDPEVAEDLGIVTPDNAYRVVQEAMAQQTARTKAAKADAGKIIAPIICGDCYQSVGAGESCAEMSRDKSGKVTIYG